MTSRAVLVSLDGSEDDLRPLAKWLRDEDELRGRVTLVESPIAPGQMGAVLDTIEVVLTSGTATTLVTSVFAWLTHRKATSKVSLKIHTKRGDDVTLTCGSSDDAQAVLFTVRKILDGED